MHLGDRIKKLREERGLTQTELASRADISQPIISRLEGKVRDNVNADVLKALAKALGCTTDYLVGMHEEDDESESEPTEAVLARM